MYFFIFFLRMLAVNSVSVFFLHGWLVGVLNPVNCMTMAQVAWIFAKLRLLELSMWRFQNRDFGVNSKELFLCWLNSFCSSFSDPFCNWFTQTNDWCGARSTPCESTGTSSSNYPETETCMIRACHTP